MKRILHMFMAMLVLAAMILLPVTDTLAAEGEVSASPAPADYITIDGVTVTLHSDSMAQEGISSLQLTLNGAADFAFDAGLAGRMTHVSRTADGVTIYIAGADPLMPNGTTLVLGTVTPAEGAVTLAKNSLIYVYGSRTITRNVVDEEEEAEPQDDDMTGMPPETAPQGGSPRTGGQPDSDFTDNNAGGVIGDGYDDGTGAGAPEPTATAEATQMPTATPGPTAEPAAATEPTQTPAATPEPVTRAADTAVPAATAQPAGPQAPATGDETVALPWALTLCLCGALLAAVLVRRKRRQ